METIAKFVIPIQTVIQNFCNILKRLDPYPLLTACMDRFHENDKLFSFYNFYKRLNG